MLFTLTSHTDAIPGALTSYQSTISISFSRKDDLCLKKWGIQASKCWIKVVVEFR